MVSVRRSLVATLLATTILAPMSQAAEFHFRIGGYLEAGGSGPREEDGTPPVTTPPGTTPPGTTPPAMGRTDHEDDGTDGVPPTARPSSEDAPPNDEPRSCSGPVSNIQGLTGPEVVKVPNWGYCGADKQMTPYSHDCDCDGVQNLIIHSTNPQSTTDDADDRWTASSPLDLSDNSSGFSYRIPDIYDAKPGVTYFSRPIRYTGTDTVYTANAQAANYQGYSILVCNSASACESAKAEWAPPTKAQALRENQFFIVRHEGVGSGSTSKTASIEFTQTPDSYTVVDSKWVAHRGNDVAESSPASLTFREKSGHEPGETVYSNVARYSGSPIRSEIKLDGNGELQVCNTPGECTADGFWTYWPTNIVTGQYVQLRTTTPVIDNAVTSLSVEIENSTPKTFSWLVTNGATDVGAGTRDTDGDGVLDREDPAPTDPTIPEQKTYARFWRMYFPSGMPPLDSMSMGNFRGGYRIPDGNLIASKSGYGTLVDDEQYNSFWTPGSGDWVGYQYPTRVQINTYGVSRNIADGAKFIDAPTRERIQLQSSPTGQEGTWVIVDEVIDDMETYGGSIWKQF